MNFLDAWTTLDPLALARWLAPAVCVAVTVLLPGRMVARLAALGVAVALQVPAIAGPPALAAGWSALWLVVAWRAGRPAAGPQPVRARRALLAGFESSVVGLALGLALLALLIAAVARGELDLDTDRRAAVALLTLGLGLMHLMLRRRARRATLSFAALGLGLQGLEDAARRVQGPGAPGVSATVLVATALAVALADRLALAREQAVGSDRVALAHDLHD